MAVSVRTSLVVSLSWFLLSGCGKSQNPAEAPAEPAATQGTEEPASAQRPTLSAEECEASGGEVTGDIGDGAIHRPDYVCASGSKPSGSIGAPEGGPIAIEGSVCCPK